MMYAYKSLRLVLGQGVESGALGKRFEGDAVEELHLVLCEVLSDERSPVHRRGCKDRWDDEEERPCGFLENELGEAEHEREGCEDSEGGVHEHESGPYGGVWGESSLDGGVVRALDLKSFNVEPWRPEVTVLDRDHEHEVVPGGTTFDWVVVGVHNAAEEFEGAVLSDGEVVGEARTHRGKDWREGWWHEIGPIEGCDVGIVVRSLILHK